MFTKLADGLGLEVRPKGLEEKLGATSWIDSGVNRKADDSEGLALVGSPTVIFPFTQESLFEAALSLEPFPLLLSLDLIPANECMEPCLL